MGPVIPRGSWFLLDTVALVYFLETNGLYSKKAEKIFAGIESGELQGILANLVFAELLVALYRSGDSKVLASEGLSIWLLAGKKRNRSGLDRVIQWITI
jgi:predicted nucleic acid-binding protein